MASEEKAPAFQFYVKDYETDEAVKLMSLEQEGAFLRLLCHAWLHGSIPASVPQLAVICRVPAAKMARLWPGVACCFMEDAPGRLVNTRLEKGRERAHKYSEQQRQRGLESARRRQESKAAAVQQDTGSTAVEQTPGSTLRLLSPFPSATDNGALSIHPSQESVTDYEPEPCSSSKGNGAVPEDLQPEYARAVLEAFRVKVGHPETRDVPSQDWATVRRWMAEGVPLRVVLRGIEETKGIGHRLAYYESSVRQEFERQQLAVGGTR